MEIEFDRDTCIGMYQCVAEWDAFEKNLDEGKADLVGGEPLRGSNKSSGQSPREESEEVGEDTFVLEVPEGEEFDAKFAARVCPVDAIKLFDDDGEQLIP